MKNFRKVLALVLVVATLFSFASVAGAYTDDAAINADYSEAVGVLSALGILNGYEDGSFKPAATIDRDEMAKMVAVLANAGDDSVHSVYAGACNFADTTSNWAKSYIGYCAHTGIVAGRSATTFDPNGKVTGLETAKMLLVVLGFDADEQGYVGSNWKVNVIRDAKNFGLLDNFAADFDATKAITREQAAQMFMNALMTNIVVGTLSDNIVKISNAAYIGIDGLNWTLIDAEKYGITLVYGNVLISSTLLIEAFKAVADLESGVDCHGRPAVKWTFVDAKGNTSSKVFVKHNMLAKTYNGVKASTAADFKSWNTGKYTIAVFEDGQYVANTFAAADALTGNGTVTEVYIDELDNTIYVVVIHTYIGTVANVSARYGTYDLVAGEAVVTLKNTAGFTNGTKVLFWLCGTNGNELCVHDHSVVAAPFVTGAYVSYSAYGKGADMFIADGKEYKYAFTFGLTLGADYITADDTKTKKNIYTDLNGYVMYIEDYKAASSATYNYGYFLAGTDIYTLPTQIWNDGKNNNGYWTMDYVGLDAKANDNAKVDAATVAAAYAQIAEYGFGGALLKYKEGETLAYAATAEVEDLTIGFLAAGNGEIVKDELYGNDNTKYLIKVGNTYTAYTGYKSIDKDYLAKYQNNEVINLQYFDEPVIDTDGDGKADMGDKIAEVVFIEAFYTTASEYFYVLGANYAASWDEIYGLTKGYDVYDVLIDGQKAVVAVAHPESWETPEVLSNGLYAANLVMLNAQAAMLVDGTKVPLYVAVDSLRYLGSVNPDILADDYKVYGDNFAMKAVGGLLKISDASAEGGFSYEDLAANVTVIDIEYKSITVVDDALVYGACEGYKVYTNDFTTLNSAEYPAAWTWIFFDANGDVFMIIREIV